MRILLIHADHFDYQVKDKALPNPEEIPQAHRGGVVEDALVVFCTVEKDDVKDPPQIVERTVASIVEVAGSVGAKRVLLYPYAHLSPNLAPPKTAITIMQNLEEGLKGLGFEASRAPFGYYKSFDLKCKGHPLSELSRTITLEPEEKKAAPPKPRPQTYHKVLTSEMKLVPPEEYRFQPGEEPFRVLVEKEALKKELPGGRPPRYLRYCKKFGIEWEEYSDLGHMRYSPEGTFIFQLVGDYAKMVADSLGVPVFEVRGTNLFDLGVKAVKEHADLFGDRLYEVKVDEKPFVLRYAACHQQFAMIKDWTLSYRDLPFGAYELADSYRLEQEGELLLCFRVRKLHMPDLHIFCQSLEEAETHGVNVHKKILEEIRRVGGEYFLLINTTETYFKTHQEIFRELVGEGGRPALVNFVPELYYWVINVEYNIIDELSRPREIGTFQIDVGNAERFGIRYVDEKGAHRHPVIIHTALIGTIERYLFALFDKIAKDEQAGKPPMLPVWLSPTQVRVIPVSREQLSAAEAVASELSGGMVRVDVDDSDETLSKKVRRAETGWVPFVVVVGEKEASSGTLSVRERKTGFKGGIKLGELVEKVRGEVGGYPWRPIPVPRHLSRRPVYQTG